MGLRLEPSMPDDKLDDLFEDALQHVVPRKDHYGRGGHTDVARAPADIAAGFKYCTKCGEKLSLDMFRPRRKSIIGYAAQCKNCDKVRFAEWRNRNLEAVR